MPLPVFKYLQDSGHGWLSVKRSQLNILGIAQDISPFSYQKGQRVYLEEDCDLPKFICALDKLGKKHHVDYLVKAQYTDGSHWIRNCENYSFNFGGY